MNNRPVHLTLISSLEAQLQECKDLFTPQELGDFKAYIETIKSTKEEFKELRPKEMVETTLRILDLCKEQAKMISVYMDQIQELEQANKGKKK